jgi:L-alanine-DL-glutamate epimerase-like enolase superfamily enzyme
MTRLTAYHVRIPLKTTIRHASHARRSTDSLIVRCELQDGTVGWGEGLPREYVTGETIEAAFPLLQASSLAGQLGAELSSLSDAIAMCEGLRLTRPMKDPRDCFGNSIRCAVELSWLDAACRHFEKPLSDVTRLYGPAAGIRHRQERVRYSAVITSSSARKQWIKSWLIRLYGFHQTKVKVGTEGIDDEATLRRVRGILGDGIDIRIDANEAWSCENLEAQLAPLLRFGISSVEQPVPHEDVRGLSVLRGRLPLPIMHDESLCSLEDARQAIEYGTCDLFNIRLSKCGGLLPSLQIAAAAHQAGLGYQLGCQVGETGILSAAGRHFASSVAGIRFLEGSYDRFLVKERLTQDDLTFGRGGYASELNGLGLGVAIDERRLHSVTIGSVEIVRV